MEVHGLDLNISDVFIITGFYELSDEYIKAEYLWIIMGISGSDYSGITYESYSKTGIKKKYSF